MTPLSTGGRFESRLVEVGTEGDVSVRLHTTSMGIGAGKPAVMLLHGFPQCSYLWREQMRVLARAGYFAIAPDLRGYNLSDKPMAMRSYRMGRLVADVRGLMCAYSLSRIHLVGHDLGGVLAWVFAARHPELLGRLVIINAPHPHRFRELLMTWGQARRSWYVFYFQLPRLPERSLVKRGMLGRIFAGTSTKPQVFTPEDVAFYEQALARPGAATAALNWYRASFHYGFGFTPRVETPTLLLWGDKDRALASENTERLDPWVSNLTVRHFCEASHWLIEEEPAAVSRELLEFLRS